MCGIISRSPSARCVKHCYQLVWPASWHEPSTLHKTCLRCTESDLNVSTQETGIGFGGVKAKCGGVVYSDPNLIFLWF